MIDYKIWLKRAKSAFLIASETPLCDELYLEDLCYDAQQAVEKALKGLLIFYGVEPEYTHNIERSLIALEVFVEIPEIIKETTELTQYAVLTRYPGEYDPVTLDEYKQAIKLAKECLDWVTEKIYTLKFTDTNTGV